MLKTRGSAAGESRIDWWRRLIARRDSAPVTLAQFCQGVGVSQRQFYYWKQRVRQTDRAAAGRRGGAVQLPIPVSNPPRRGITATSFVPVSVVEQPTHTSELELELANGCVVRLKGSIDSGLLQSAIAAAGQLGSSLRGDR